MPSPCLDPATRFSHKTMYLFKSSSPGVRNKFQRSTLAPCSTPSLIISSLPEVGTATPLGLPVHHPWCGLCWGSESTCKKCTPTYSVLW